MAARVERVNFRISDYYDVDLFEDELAARIGFVRHPSCPLDEWRRQRVRLIDAAEDEGGLPVDRSLF